ncbi:hypothetical protein N7513_005435 [Penicillium frequentans]|nr:hypothetical protein N7513_005435 [Penicillium glabrum]
MASKECYDTFCDRADGPTQDSYSIDTENPGNIASRRELQPKIIDLATSSDYLDSNECVEIPPQYNRNRDTEKPGDTPSRHKLQTEIINFAASSEYVDRSEYVDGSECVDCNEHVKSFPQDNHDRDIEKAMDTPSRHELQTEIIHLWETVWYGLYEIEDGDGIYRGRKHYERLETLYQGAGLSMWWFTIGNVIKISEGSIETLLLFDNAPISDLKSVVEILKAYVSEIANLKQLFSILGEAQLELGQLLEPGANVQETKKKTKKRFLAVAQPMERRIKKYNVRMNVLTMTMSDEAIASRVEDVGKSVYSIVFSSEDAEY